MVISTIIIVILSLHCNPSPPQHFPAGDPPIHLGREPLDECQNTPITCESCPPFAPMIPQPRDGLVYEARIGPSGSDRGYMALTGNYCGFMWILQIATRHWAVVMYWACTCCYELCTLWVMYWACSVTVFTYVLSMLVEIALHIFRSYLVATLHRFQVL